VEESYHVARRLQKSLLTGSCLFGCPVLNCNMGGEKKVYSLWFDIHVLVPSERYCELLLGWLKK